MAFLRIFVFLLLVFAFPIVVNADGITNISKTNKLLTLAAESMKKKDFKSAIDAYEKAFKESPDLPAQANLNLAHAYLQSRDYRQAQKNYLIAAGNLTSPSLISLAYQQIGNIYSAQKDYKTAMEWYKKSLKTQPENSSARYNYELAYKLNQKKEEEDKKRNPQKDPKKEPQQQNKKEEKSQKESSKKDSKEDSQPENKKQQEKDQPKKGSPEDKNKELKNSKEGKEQPGENSSETGKKQEDGKEEKPDPEGKDKSAQKNQETNMDDPEAQRMDKKKLLEAGLTEDQAKNLLQAMRQNEVKYLQQRRFKSTKGGRDKDKPRW